MRNNQIIEEKAQSILKLLIARTSTGMALYKYGDILNILGIPNTNNNRRCVSDIALANGLRRRAFGARTCTNGAGPVEEQAQIEEQEEMESLFVAYDKRRFLEACHEFADFYFK